MSRRSRRAGESPVSFFSFQDVITSVTGIIVLVTLLLTLELVTRAELIAVATPPESAGRLDSRAVDQQAADARERREELRQQVEGLRGVLEQAAAASPLVSDQEVASVREDVISLERDNAQSRTQVAAARMAVDALGEALRRERDAQGTAANQSAKTRDRIEALQRSKRLVLLPGAGDEKRPLIVECAAGHLTVGAPDESGELLQLRRWKGRSAIDDMIAWSLTREGTAEYFVVMVRPDGVNMSDRVIERLRGAGFDVGWEPAPAGENLFEPDPR